MCFSIEKTHILLLQFKNPNLETPIIKTKLDDLLLGFVKKLIISSAKRFLFWWGIGQGTTSIDAVCYLKNVPKIRLIEIVPK